MKFSSFKELIESVKTGKSKKIVAVVEAQDEHTLQAVFKAEKITL